MGNITFRWAIGFNSYYWWHKEEAKEKSGGFCLTDLVEFREKWSHDTPEFTYWFNLSVGSAQSLYPGNRYVIMYNGDDDNGIQMVEYMLQQCKDVDESQVEVVNKKDYENPFHFEPPESVWWKWIPLDFGYTDIEITLDADTLFIGKQTLLPRWIEGDKTTLFVKELGQPGWGHYHMNMLNRINEHINVGFLAVKNSSPFRKMFLIASKHIPYVKNDNMWSNFYAETESGNLAYVLMKQHNSEEMEIADPDIYGWWDNWFITPKMEWCHFVGARKILMMAFYALLIKFVHLGTKITTIDRSILFTLTNTEHGMAEAKTILRGIQSKKLIHLYNNLTLLYNVKAGDYPPVDLLKITEDHKVIPADAIFMGSEQDGNHVKASYTHDGIPYVVEGDLTEHLEFT